MAKRIYSATPGAGLTAQATKAYDQYIEVDFDGWSETKHMSLDTLLRTKVVQDLDETGKTIGTIDFTNNDSTVMTIDANYLFRVSGIADNEVVYLKVIKGASNIFTIDSALSEYEITKSYQTGLTELFFRITTITKPLSTTKYIFEPLVKQKRSSLASSKFTFDAGTISAFSYFRYSINNNICSFEGSMIMEANTITTEINVTIADWDITKLNSGTTPCALAIKNNGVFALGFAEISANTLAINLTANLAVSDLVTIEFNGSFEII